MRYLFSSPPTPALKCSHTVSPGGMWDVWHNVKIEFTVIFFQESASSRLLLAPELWGKSSTAFLSLLLCRLDHRHYLLECPHKYSVADLRQVRASRGRRGFPGENIPVSVKRGASSSPAEHLKQLRLPFALLPSVTCALRARTSARRQIIAFILICQNNWRKPVSSESYGDHAREIVSPLFKPALLLLSLCTNLYQSRITLAVTGTWIWHRLQSPERVVGAAAGALWGPVAPQARGVWVVLWGDSLVFTWQHETWL